MDAYSISYTLPSRRSASRIYQDLAACRLSNRSSSTDDEMHVSNKVRNQKPSKPPRICVIGAGISGLRCADILIKRGFDVAILEARDRIGGRTHQASLPSGHLVDLGPNWIHGTDHNPILDLAKQTNTATHTWGENVTVFSEDGKILEDGRSLSDTMWGIIVQAFKYSAENTATIDSKESLHDFFEKKVQEALSDAEDSERRRIIMQMSHLWGAFVGSSVARQSLKFFWLEECIDGENLFCAGTYEKILARIAKPVLERADVKLSTKVNRIETISDTVSVFTDNGLEYEYDEVVMTAPLGWLQKNKQTFHPPLPSRLAQAIDNIGYGTLEKVFVTFPRAFWLNDRGEPADPQFKGGFTQWLSPLYAENTNPRRWNQENVDLATLPGPCAHPTLLYYIYGDQSVTLSSDLAGLSEKDQQDYLTKFFQPYFSILPNYVENSKDCIPATCLATNWTADELAGYGSYTTFRTGLEEGDKDIEIMREGLPGRGLWFAGEAMSPFVALGTTTGAYWSGEAVGRRIAEAYGMTGSGTGSPHEVEDIVSSDGAKEINVRGFGDMALDK